MDPEAISVAAGDNVRRFPWRLSWAPAASAPMRRLAYLGREFLLRLGACSAEFIFVCAAILAYSQDHSRITLLLMAASSLITIGAFLVARAAIQVDWHPLALATLPVIYGYPILVDVRPGPHILPEWLATAIQLLALVWVIYAKLSLGRSFGLLPANRGIIVSGAYRWLRHPIYAGYIVIFLGFLSASFSWRNLLVYTVLQSVQMFRLLREEKLLSGDGDYRAYRSSVRYRLIPGVF